MKKTIAAVAAGLALVASQAVAQSTAAPRVSDRLGAAPGDSEELAGVPFVAIIAALGVAVAAGYVLIGEDDESESD